jgi:hypothetical protein
MSMNGNDHSLILKLDTGYWTPLPKSYLSLK